MARTKTSVASRKRKKRILEEAKGFRGASSKNIRTAYDAVDKARSHAYTGRKQKKHQYRRLWTVRINAACRMNDMNYSTFINGLKKAEININRKMLSEIAVNDPEAFKTLVEKAKKQLAE